MELQTKIKALSRLAESNSEAARLALRQEIEQDCRTLSISNSFDELDAALDILKEIGYRESKTTEAGISGFVRTVEQRKLTHPEELAKISGSLDQYRNAEMLIGKATEVVSRLRYLETKRVFHLLLDLTAHPKDRVSKKALQELESLASYDIGVFFGRGNQPGIGAVPQIQIVEEIESLAESSLRAQFHAVVSVLNRLLSPTMGGSTWSYRAVTISKAAIPTDASISAVRERSIGLLLRLFKLSATAVQKASVIGALHAATRTERALGASEDSLDVFIRDAKRILEFFESIVATEDMPLVQKIEHDSYWIHYHGVSTDVKQAALRVRDAINGIPEYQIYKTLIGFEGVFEDWEGAKREGSYSEHTKARRNSARDYARSVSEENYAEWRDRILRYCAIESNDLATFQVFYDFLDELGRSNSTIALKLLTGHTAALARVLVSLLVGLWKGDGRGATRDQITKWIAAGEYLRHSMRLFWDNPETDLDLVSQLLARAIDLNDSGTARDAVTVAVSNYATGTSEVVNRLMMPALDHLTARQDASWIFDNWYRPELKVLTQECDEAILNAMVKSLLFIRRIDYHVEEILYLIALRVPDAVVDFFVKRAGAAFVSDAVLAEDYEDLPFQLNKVNEPLSRHAGLVVTKFRVAYDGNYANAVINGGRFLARVFPSVTAEFEKELLKLVDRNAASDLEFVLSILRNYEGEPFIHNLCKAIVRILPKESRLLTEVRIALYSTGVVTGELGFVLAYEKKIDEIRPWLDDQDAKVREFASTFMADLAAMAAEERQRAEERTILERHRYGLNEDPAK